jgi:hypothetical protein
LPSYFFSQWEIVLDIGGPFSASMAFSTGMTLHPDAAPPAEPWR